MTLWLGNECDALCESALAFLKNHADAEEITQDTFIRAHRGLAKFRGDSSLATWLHRIAVNLALDRKRRRPMLPIETAVAVPDGSMKPQLAAIATGRARRTGSVPVAAISAAA